MPTRFKAVIFDFDGTLADSYDAIAASVNHVRAANGLPPLSVQEVKKHVGRGPGYLLAHTVGVGDPERNAAMYRAHHPTVMRPLTRLLPGASEAINSLRARGLKLAVCSNKPRDFTVELLASLRLENAFDAVLGPEDVARPKPAPDMLLAVMRRLDVLPAETLYIGDMTVDVLTARAAGTTVWVVPTGSDDGADLVVAKPDHLLKHLGELSDLLG